MLALRKKGEEGNGEISRDDIASVLMGKEKTDKPKTSISFKVKDIREKYFEEDTTAETIESTIDNLLAHYKNGDFDSILRSSDTVSDDGSSDDSEDEKENIVESIMNDHDEVQDSDDE